MSASAVDRAVDDLARRQHGAFSYQQVRAEGGDSRLIRRRLEAGRWIELDRRVYALPSSPRTWHRRCMAATLAIERAAISHRAAAARHGLAGFRPGQIHVVVPYPGRHVSRLARVHQSGWPQFTTVDGVTTVTLADTLFQLAGHSDSLRFRTAFQEAIADDRLLLGRIMERFVDLAHRRLPGIGRMRDLLHEHDHGDVPPQSELERMLDAMLDEVEGLPTRRHQAPLPGWDRGEARVDVLVPDWRLILEADGRRWHARVEDFERDRWRDNVAATQGYQVLRFTYRQLTAQRDETLALLRRFAAARHAA